MAHLHESAAGAPPVVPLLATKLFVPRPRPDLVARPRLLARLHDGLETGVCTALSAPAGAGKTSLLAAWAAELERPVAWLALDERDQDVARFLRYLSAALQAVVPGRTPSWGDGPAPAAEAVLTELINDVADARAAGLLVLDDNHVVRSPPVHAAVAFLLDHLPPDLHLAVASREDPPLPLHRLRARGRLVELRAADLGFTLEEAAALLEPRARLAPEQVATLVERTEGWAAGLQLAGLALRGRADPGEFVSAFAGGHRLVVDYLSTEVLARLPERTRSFLTATAALDRLSGPLCDAVLDRDGSQQILEELERANLFVVPLDDERTWYRYHHLFADMLRALGSRTGDRDQARAVHRRASAWFAGHRLMPEAIHHALAAGAHDDAARWLEPLTPVMFGSIDVHNAMEEWLAALPEASVRSRPILCLAQAWLLIHHLRIPAAAEWAQAARQALPPDAQPHARGAVTAVLALLSTLGPEAQPEQACALARRALTDLPPAAVPFRGIAAVAHGQAATALGRVDEAEDVLTRSADEGRAARLLHGALVVAGYQVAVQRLRGARMRALATGRAALSWGYGEEGTANPGLGVLSVLVADLLADGDDPADALALMVEGHRTLRRYRERPPLMLLASLGLARLHLLAGDAAAADAALTEFAPVVAQGPFAGLSPMLAAGQAQVRFASGDTAAAVAWAQGPQVPIPTTIRLQTHVFAAGLATLLLAPAQILVSHGVATGDRHLLRRAGELLDSAEARARPAPGWLLLRVSILRGAVAAALGDHATARGELAGAVAVAAPECVVRPFVDAGPPVQAVLTQLRRGSETSGTAAFVDAVLRTFPDAPEQPARPRTGLVEPLTAREHEVLQLLADGRSNAGMARLLTVEQSTVKTHLIHLYEKLGVHSRTQAVARARALRLLDEG